MERFLDYWRAGVQQQMLHDFISDQASSFWESVSVSDRSNRLKADAVVKIKNSKVVIIPFYARRGIEYFIPLLLIAEYDAEGNFVPRPYLSLPIIPYASFGSTDEFANYMAINPPPWLEEEQSFSCNDQLNYAAAMLDAVMPQWRVELEQMGYQICPDALMFPLANLPLTNEQLLADLNFKLLAHPQKITLIDAELHSGADQHAQQLIINAWIQAALKQSEPPLYVWLKPKSKPSYANIFACLGASSNSYTTTDMHTELVTAHENFLLGQQLLRSWQEVSKRINEKYTDKGGVQVRLNQLRVSARDAKAQSRHVQVLHSIWIRQKELLVVWAKMFDFIPGMQKQRLQRLYNFFKQNFPNEKVGGFTQAEFDDLFNEKLRRAENNERMIGDALHQIENDLYQETLVRDKCLQWCKQQDVHSESATDLKDFLQNTLWQKVARLALIYWQQDFAAKQGYADFLNQEPREIDLLIVEHAQYISPMQGAYWLSKSKKAVVMGNYNPICNPRFSVQIDYELTKHFALVENDADFEDLQFDGLLASVGNMWNMVAKDREADQIFTRQVYEPLKFELIDCQASSQPCLGSLINPGVVDHLVNWLNKHADQRSDINIYTSFAAQQQLLQEALQSSFYAQIPIRLIHEPYFTKAKINIFVPVYAATDQGPYIFDRGTEILDQLVANTAELLVIIGEQCIFKPELHSATGKFAQLIFQEKQPDPESINIITEANCV